MSPPNRDVLSKHARDEMERRAIPSELVEQVASTPEQVVPGNDPETVVHQSRIAFGGRGIRLVRVVVNTLADPNVVVTVYQTSKIAKYWRTQ